MSALPICPKYLLNHPLLKARLQRKRKQNPPKRKAAKYPRSQKNQKKAPTHPKNRKQLNQVLLMNQAQLMKAVLSRKAAKYRKQALSSPLCQVLLPSQPQLPQQPRIMVVMPLLRPMAENTNSGSIITAMKPSCWNITVRKPMWYFPLMCNTTA